MNKQRIEKENSDKGNKGNLAEKHSSWLSALLCLNRYTIRVIGFILLLCFLGACASFLSRVKPPQNDVESFYNVPSYLFCNDNEDTTISIIWDANISIPEKPYYSDIAVKAREFTEVELARFISCIVGENRVFSEKTFTKSEWEELLQQVKSKAKDAVIPPDLISNIELNIASAPLYSNREEVDFFDLPKGKLSTVYVEGENNTHSLVMLERNGNQFVYFRDANSYILGKGLCVDALMDPKTTNKELYQWLYCDKPDITEQEALIVAFDYMDKLGVDLSLFTAEPCTVLTNYVEKTTGWKFIFTRKIDNLQSQYEDGKWSFVNPKVPPKVGGPWEQEACVVVVDDKGLCELWWQGASTIDTRQMKSAKLQSFNAIQHRIESQLDEIFRIHTNENGDFLELKITKLHLGVSLIAHASKVNVGRYVPTWYIDFLCRWETLF